jgi:hypothetical protein
MRVLQAWRARFRGKTVSQGIAAMPDGELVFETWCGSWVELERGGRAITGILREVGLDKNQIEKVLQQALEAVREPE